MYVMLILLKYCYMDSMKCAFLKKNGKIRHIQNYQNKLGKIDQYSEKSWTIIYTFSGISGLMTYIIVIFTRHATSQALTEFILLCET